MAENEKKSFFATLPGILTGVAAIVSAFTGLYLALRDSPEPEVAQLPKEATEVACSIAGLVFDSDSNKPLSSVWVDLYRDLSSIQQRPLQLKANAATTGPDGKFLINCGGVEHSQYPLLLAVRHRDWVATRITGPKIERGGDWEGIRIPIPMSDIELKKLRELSVSFGGNKIGSDRFLNGEVENKSERSFPCVMIKFNMSTSYQDKIQGEPARHLGYLDLEIRDLGPHEVRPYEKKLPGDVGVSLHSKQECG